ALEKQRIADQFVIPAGIEGHAEATSLGSADGITHLVQGGIFGDVQMYRLRPAQGSLEAGGPRMAGATGKKCAIIVVNHHHGQLRPRTLAAVEELQIEPERLDLAGQRSRKRIGPESRYGRRGAAAG